MNPSHSGCHGPQGRQILHGQGQMNHYYNTKNLILSSIALLFICLVIQRTYVILTFSAIYTDHDQLLMWLGATDYMNFSFQEPCFYGQNYNIMIESFFATIFLWWGIPHNYALSISTTIIALAPFVLLSAWAIRDRLYLTAFLSLALILFMPLRFHLLTSMSRGFIPGPALAAIVSLYTLSTDNKYRFFVFGFFGMISIAVLPTAALIILPFAFYLSQTYVGNVCHYKQLILGGSLGGSVFLIKEYFYAVNFEYNYFGHQLDELSGFSFKNIFYNFNEIDKYISDVVPFGSYFAAFCFLLLIVISFRKERAHCKNLFVLSFIILTLFSFGFDRVSSGSNEIFYSFSRFYIYITYGLLLILRVADCFWSRYLSHNKFSYSMLAIIVIFLPLNFNDFNEKLFRERSYIDDRYYAGGVFLASVDSVYAESAGIKSAAEKNGIDLIITNDQIINYAYPALNRDDPPTILLPSGMGKRLERRTWRIKEEQESIRKRILLVNYKNKYKMSPLLLKYAEVASLGKVNNSHLYLIENKYLLSTRNLFNLVGIDFNYR
jgi:hypothetical protein